jgi:hypothetical protein
MPSTCVMCLGIMQYNGLSIVPVTYMLLFKCPLKNSTE